MNEAYVAISLLWIFIFIYSIAGAIDFGAGFWAFVFEKNEQTRAGVLANKFLSPTWKITNVFLVLIVIAFVGFFPRATFMLGTLLLWPVCIILILLTVRSSFMVYAYSAKYFQRALKTSSAISGILIPSLFISVLPITLGGFIEEQNGTMQIQFMTLLQSVTLYTHIGFGLTSALYLSALFLADYAREARDNAAYIIYRKWAIILGPLTLGFAVLVTETMVEEASWIVDRFRDNGLWFGLSIAAFIFAYISLWIKKGDDIGHPRFAVVGCILQYGLASYAYGNAHMPYIIYPILTIEQGVTNPEMFRSLLLSYSIGIVILVPSFILFWKLFLKDQKYLNPNENPEE
ncbi:cytochrome d ubiquinol oxidase subunit II [Longirhabdus pacifica]|uniref:cytochrome d ubiquinol oxidase subunit II n=1 Tax=Longirhabdus pacifica TaxID=2305227 RepID=UPI001008D9F9|nr:cytochrome d ubiquinol oxidase subunit II [Longirhabdus pacifica]